MRRRNFLTTAAAGAVGAVAMPGIASAATIRSARHAPANLVAANTHDGIDPNSLRALAARVGLHIGSAIVPFDINTPAYNAIASSQFSVVTPGNEMKWGVVEPVQGQFDWSGADNLVNFAEGNGQLVRGHTLLWHNQLPNWLTTGVGNGSITTSQLWGLLEAHIFTEVGRYRGRIWQWDVANEFFTDSNPSMLNPNDFWIKNLGPTVLPQAFKWAHEADPHAILFYNDYNIGGEDGSNAKSDAAFAFLQQMLSQNVPVMGVGNQGHLDTQFGWSPQRLQADLERYASIGLKVAITEADVRTFVDGPTTQVPTNSLALFAQPFELSQMLTAALAVPELLSFTHWGFSDADSWVPGFFTGEGYATIYDVNLNPKPAYMAIQQALQLAAFGAPHHQDGLHGFGDGDH